MPPIQLVRFWIYGCMERSGFLPAPKKTMQKISIHTHTHTSLSSEGSTTLLKPSPPLNIHWGLCSNPQAQSQALGKSSDYKSSLHTENETRNISTKCTKLEAYLTWLKWRKIKIFEFYSKGIETKEVCLVPFRICFDFWFYGVIFKTNWDNCIPLIIVNYLLVALGP